MDRGRRVRAPSARGALAGGFTLMELVLVLLLTALLAGLAISAFGGSLEAAQVRESAERMTMLLRTARAEAANEGKRLRLAFDAETGQPALAVQADPLGEPATFTPYAGWWVDASQLEAGVYVARCDLTGPDAYYERPPDEDNPLAQVSFYPDGTSDSARILLARNTGDGVWAVEITLNGVDGTIDQRTLDPEENEQDAKLMEDLATEAQP